jgi:tetratricopeptide (TPR) repeat protein
MTLQASPEGQFVTAVVQSALHTQNGNQKEANKALDEAAALRATGTRAGPQLMLKMAEACMAHGRNEEADVIVSDVARNAHDSESLLDKAKQIYLAAGRQDAGAAVLSAATNDVRKLNNEGVMLAQKGNYRLAVDKLLTACREAPHNPRIIMNAVWVILKCLDQEGMDEALLEEARRRLDEAERQTPGHNRIKGLRLHMKEVEARFGIRRRSA